jgi:ABC-2 type transport system permease protein
MMALVLHQAVLSLKLNFRNRMAVIYGFLFPLIFLIAFWAFWRHDEVPLAFHLGQLLTVTVLGGACFGLPTTLVSEREQGVWRRYAITPAPVYVFIAALLTARYVLLLVAALLQLALGFAFGMPVPLHPFALLVTFTVAALSFIGFGLVIAMLADTVPAVQALGQCIFLPMLMVGGVAVPLSSLPDWAGPVSSFFPGRYAVTAMQAAVTGRGLPDAGFALAALVLIGLAGGLAAARMFRWDAGQRFLARPGKSWLVLALGMWIAVGVVAQLSGRLHAVEAANPQAIPTATDFRAADRPMPASWRDVTPADFKAIAFDRLPPDNGVVAPIAGPDEKPDVMMAQRIAAIDEALQSWPPGMAADPVQRVRNWLSVAAVPDVLQMYPLERFLPPLVFARLREMFGDADLAKLLYWVAMHPEGGSDTAMRHLDALGLPAINGPMDKPRARVMLYAFKFLDRLRQTRSFQRAQPARTSR